MGVREVVSGVADLIQMALDSVQSWASFNMILSLFIPYKSEHFLTG